MKGKRQIQCSLVVGHGTYTLFKAFIYARIAFNVYGRRRNSKTVADFPCFNGPHHISFGTKRVMQKERKGGKLREAEVSTHHNVTVMISSSRVRKHKTRERERMSQIRGNIYCLRIKDILNGVWRSFCLQIFCLSFSSYTS